VRAHIRLLGIDLHPDDRAYVRRKLGMKLGKFATSIERVSVRVEDVNGPRGGVDQVCRIKVVLIGLPTLVFQARNDSLEAAIDGAVAGTERAVRRSVQRRRMTPIRGRAADGCLDPPNQGRSDDHAPSGQGGPHGERNERIAGT
jgi:putative sigma-54 modulation protein